MIAAGNICSFNELLEFKINGYCYFCKMTLMQDYLIVEHEVSWGFLISGSEFQMMFIGIN